MLFFAAYRLSTRSFWIVMHKLLEDDCKNIAIVIWSQKRGDCVLEAILNDWLAYSEKIGVKLFVATDSEELDYQNKILFSKSGWQGEWLQVGKFLLENKIERFISILDDFLFLSAPDKASFLRILELVSIHNCDYLSLEPHPARHNVYDTIFGTKNDSVKTLNSNDHYISSLRPSLWRTALFIQTIKESSSIWNFETTHIQGFTYLTVIESKLRFRIKHVIEKGKLNYNFIYLDIGTAKKLNLRYGYDYKQIYRLPKILLSNLAIMMFGYRLHNVLSKYRNSLL